ncbi:MAG: helix-turn-helix domain-containing protein [Planctomycetota bacterium]|nr:helix-turn-helix domain-containing protein [Planctomycetota bacterium]
MKQLREETKITPAELDDKLILGPGWIERFETGQTIPSMGLILAILRILRKTPNELFGRITVDDIPGDFERKLYAVQDGRDLLINFDYAKHDAQYRLVNATIEQFDFVVKTLRDGLSVLTEPDDEKGQAVKKDAVANAFLAAVKQWSHANPSDIWWFLIYRAYCDPFNHPARFARLDFEQSWKRTGGWALEEVMVRHYAPFLKKNGIKIWTPSIEEKKRLLKTIRTSERLEADKVDVVLSGDTKQGDVFFGVVHVKASFAERRTDDVPMSRVLIAAGCTSPLWTMDCKSIPSTNPVNRSELGDSLTQERDKRSAKRKDIEDDGVFSACFSYNSNTVPTPPAQKAKSRIYTCNLTNSDDAFSRFIVNEWLHFHKH